MVDKLMELDLFKMFKNFKESMVKDFKVSSYSDCVQVTHPSEKESILVVLQGAVHVISDDKIFKRVNFEVRKKRRKRAKAIEKGLKPDE